MQHTKEVLIGVGLTVAIAVIAGAILGGATISQAQTESLEIVSSELKKGTSGEALLSVKIQNAGNSPIGTITGTLNFDTVPDVAGNTATIGIQPFEFPFTPTDLEPGSVTVYVSDVPNSGGMSMGQSFTLSVEGITSSNLVIQDTAVATVNRF